jgi:hypothetical protein
MEIMFGFQNVNAPYREEIKRLLRKLLQLLWIPLQEKKWVIRLLLLQEAVIIIQQEL